MPPAADTQRTVVRASEPSEVEPFVEKAPNYAVSQKACCGGWLRWKSLKQRRLEEFLPDDVEEAVGQQTTSVVSWKKALLAAAAIMVAAACYLWWRLVQGLAAVLWCIIHPTPFLVAFLVLLSAGAISPLRAGFGLKDAIALSVRKLKAFCMVVVLPIGFYYFQVSHVYDLLQEFWHTGYTQFFFLILFGVLVAAASYAVLVRGSVTFGDWLPQLAVPLLPLLACLQVLPAGCFVLALFEFLLADTPERLREKWRSLSIEAIISSSNIAELLLVQTYAMVQTYALLHHDLARSQEGSLQLWVLIGAVCLVKCYVGLDAKEKVLRVISASPYVAVTGSAARSELAFWAVVWYRVVAVLGRLLLIPFFQVLTHDFLSLPLAIDIGATFFQPAIGAFLFLALDVGMQAALIYGGTASPWKMGWGVANVISPTEPILYDGAHPLFTVKPRVAAGVHAVQALLAACIVIFVHGGAKNLVSFVFQMMMDTDKILLMICACCCILQLPLLLLVQYIFAEWVESSDTCGCLLVPGESAKCNESDLAVPLQMALLSMVNNPDAEAELPATPFAVVLALKKRLQGGENPELRRLLLAELLRDPRAGDPAEVRHLTVSRCSAPDVFLLGTLLKKNTQLQSLNLNSNQIGDVGAEALAEGLRDNPSLETLHLVDCGIGAAGKRVLKELCEKKPNLQIHFD